MVLVPESEKIMTTEWISDYELIEEQAKRLAEAGELIRETTAVIQGISLGSDEDAVVATRLRKRMSEWLKESKA